VYAKALCLLLKALGGSEKSRFATAGTRNGNISMNVLNVLGSRDYELDQSLQMVDHVVNNDVYDDRSDEYELSHPMTAADVQATPPRRRGYCLPFNLLLS